MARSSFQLCTAACFHRPAAPGRKERKRIGAKPQARVAGGWVYGINFPISAVSFFWSQFGKIVEREICRQDQLRLLVVNFPIAIKSCTLSKWRERGEGRNTYPPPPTRTDDLVTHFAPLPTRHNKVHAAWPCRRQNGQRGRRGPTRRLRPNKIPGTDLLPSCNAGAIASLTRTTMPCHPSLERDPIYYAAALRSKRK